MKLICLSVFIVTAVGCIGYLDHIDFGDKFFRRISSVVYEINAVKATTEGVQHLAVAACALAATVWLVKRWNPKS